MAKKWLQNLTGLDFRQAAVRFERGPCSIVDFHIHLHGSEAITLYKEVAQLFNISFICTMSRYEELDSIAKILPDKVHFITMHSPWTRHRAASTQDYIAQIHKFFAKGSRIVKFWNAPRIYDYAEASFVDNPWRLDSQGRFAAMQAAADLGMAFMVHVGDPSSWFNSTYADPLKYGTKAMQYEMFEHMLNTFNIPTIAAHMGGYPEDLSFLGRLLERHPHLSLDCSATKWIVRELGKHPVQTVREFFIRHQDRILFGSDIVTSEDHLRPGNKQGKGCDASSYEEAFDLYASRYFALRTLLESEGETKSPIFDPDYSAQAPESPVIKGLYLPAETLEKIYHTNAVRFLAQAGSQDCGSGLIAPVDAM